MTDSYALVAGDEPITAADVTNRKDAKCENGDIINKSHSHHGRIMGSATARYGC